MACQPLALDLLDVDQRAPAELLGPEAGDVDVAQARRQRHVVAVVAELPGQTVHRGRRHRRQRDHHARGPGRLEDVRRVLEAAEDGHPAAHTEVVGPDEPDDVVAQLGLALGGVHQADGVGVRADDHDRPGQDAGAAHPGEDPPGDRALDDQQHGDEDQHRHDPQAGQGLELQGERHPDDDADADERRVDDAPDLFAGTGDRPGEVELVQRHHDQPHGQGEDGERQVAALHAELVVRAHERLPGERQHQTEGDGHRVGGHQPLTEE